MTKAVAEEVALTDVDAAFEAVKTAYAAGETDEFVKPRVLAGGEGVIRDGDAVFFFNFRADRAREITKALAFADFDAFARGRVPALSGYATMTEYDGSFGLPAAFRLLSQRRGRRPGRQPRLGAHTHRRAAGAERHDRGNRRRSRPSRQAHRAR